MEHTRTDMKHALWVRPFHSDFLISNDEVSIVLDKQEVLDLITRLHMALTEQARKEYEKHGLKS